MEQTLGMWVAPVLMIPGLALLVISTANRYSQLLLYSLNNPGASGLRRQLRDLRLALVLLYVGIAVHAVAGLLGGILSYSAEVSQQLMLVLSCVGVACLVGASIALTLDALRAARTETDR